MTDVSRISLSFSSVREALTRRLNFKSLIEESVRRARAASGDGIFTALVPEADVFDRVEQLQRRADRGERLPLLGLTFAVKDNIHVAGMATTSNCPGLSIMPAESARAVRLVEEAGAVLIGKNTMDQFATGLNGTRSPEPLCRNAIDRNYIPGGSSSGSAVAVARDIVSFTLGSDTGGSGRVPAACNGIVGLKPTIGLVSTRGLLFNSRILDVIPVFTRQVEEAYEILELIAGYDADDPFSREDAGRIDLAMREPDVRTIAIPRADQLRFFGDDHAAEAFQANIEALGTCGFDLVEIDFRPFEEAGRLVFQSPLVAERLCDYGEVIANRPDTIHPAVWAAIEPGLSYTAREAFEAFYELRRRRNEVVRQLSGVSALAVPTVPTIFTIEQMLAEPMTRNSIMGTYTYFANPLDLCAVSVPGKRRNDGLPSALCFAAIAGQDGVLRKIASAFESASLNAHGELCPA